MCVARNKLCAGTRPLPSPSGEAVAAKYLNRRRFQCRIPISNPTRPPTTQAADTSRFSGIPMSDSNFQSPVPGPHSNFQFQQPPKGLLELEWKGDRLTMEAPPRYCQKLWMTSD